MLGFFEAAHRYNKSVLVHSHIITYIPIYLHMKVW